MSSSCVTAREREVFELALRGYTNARIATDVHVSLPTVKSHIKSILRKLGLKGRKDIPISRLWDKYIGDSAGLANLVL
ncbi:response regulator transcription factor [Rubrobacter radiotolerans]|uniref:Helix-turn-helix transcriptional regulator n=1 Tax=Rubrobacter radiotolerans TaxID=42256 RepID=A0AB35T7U9_RUBRA|nr:helix-turn-helix transcriptional regulator [Rubrobacter radiotolerans]MDX5895618.1 helix-turn-helix transcriptional regulator [Rubrobacter radiotolerans]